jgi:pilus assembly protein Flp/PilA
MLLEHYIKAAEALKRLRADQDGVVSFEYLIVAACIIAVVSIAFGNGGALQTAMTTAISAIGTAITTAVAAG